MTNNTDNHFKHPGSGSDNALVVNGSLVSNKVVQNTTVVTTLAEINAGATLVAGVDGQTITVVDFAAKVNGTFATATSIDLEDTDASPVSIASVAIAGASDGAILVPAGANITEGAGYLGALTTGAGVAVTKTGSDATGGTDITWSVTYIINE